MRFLLVLIYFLNFIYFINSFQLITLHRDENVHKNSEKDWWEAATIYQVYPRSFKDSNGDGIGDLNGIAEKLPHLKELGIDATWLSPIFKSPMADFGYDISDYFDIQPEYGTMKDFENLLKIAKELKIKIILDFVPNHSSDENEWFKKSVNREADFEDFYVWHPGYPDPSNSSNRLPPSNWISFFRFSAWQWNDKRQEFYLHQFHHKQPDLNYRNPKVVEEMKSVLRFWLDKGVDGFRIDAVPALFEIKPDENNRYKDEPKSGWTNDTDDPSYLLHIYTQNQDETLDMVYQWRSVMDEYKKMHAGETRVILTEAYSSIETIMKYYGDANSREGSNIPFNFYFITDLNKNSNVNDINRIIYYWIDNLPKQRTPNWVVGNHDQRRAASRYGVERTDGLAMIELMLPGTGIVYNGEEIGMTDVWISWKDTVDPQACNTNPQVYEKYSRDPERTPFQWDDTISAGFSTNEKTWLPISPDYKSVNVKLQIAAENSHLKIYQNLIKLRKNDVLKNGNLQIKTFNNNVIVIYRHLDNYISYISIVNWESRTENINLYEIDSRLPDLLIYEIVSLNSKHKIGETVKTDTIILEPNESFVLKTKKIKINLFFFDIYY